MTAKEIQSRDRRMIRSITLVIHAHSQLQHYAAALQITIENATVLLRGNLPSDSLKASLVGVVRTAGVLNRIDNCVHVQ